MFGPNDYSTLHGGGTNEYALLGNEMPELREVIKSNFVILNI